MSTNKQSNERVGGESQIPRYETYLGDGLYASHDGGQLWLRTPRFDGDHRVALNPITLQHLLEYLQRNGHIVAPVAVPRCRTCGDPLPDGYALISVCGSCLHDERMANQELARQAELEQAERDGWGSEADEEGQ